MEHTKIKKVIFSLLFLLLFTKSLSAGDMATDLRMPAKIFVELQNAADKIAYTSVINGKTYTFLQGSVTVFGGTSIAEITASIIEREIVEWRTVSKTIPVSGNILYAINLSTVLNQVGTKYLVKYAQIEWKGKTKEFELERTAIKSDSILERQISE